MTEDEIEAVIRQHLFSFKGRCECGEYLGTNPDAIVKHFARKIHEALQEVV
jgi:hypothetical protein